jgi:DNA-binding Lrp family transcriptional regulator
MSTFGGILIKCDSQKARGKEGELRNFISGLAQWLTSKTEIPEKPAICPQCRRGTGQEHCFRLEIVSCASLTGFFDFMLTVRTQDIETLEQFVLDCLKNGAMGEVIAETQTLAGAFILPRRASRRAQSRIATIMGNS